LAGEGGGNRHEHDLLSDNISPKVSLYSIELGEMKEAKNFTYILSKLSQKGGGGVDCSNSRGKNRIGQKGEDQSRGRKAPKKGGVEKAWGAG